MKNKKNDPKTVLISFAVVLGITLIGNLEDGNVGGAIVGVLLVIAALVLSNKKLKDKIIKKKESFQEEKATETVSYSRPTAASDAAYYEECDYGDYNCDFSHDYETRVKQLNDWLKNGIIDKKEYKTMMEKYRKNYEEHHN